MHLDLMCMVPKMQKESYLHLREGEMVDRVSISDRRAEINTVKGDRTDYAVTGKKQGEPVSF